MNAPPDPDGTGPEQVVLLADDGTAIGLADKATVHHASTPLHLAFSCYVFDDADRLLLTRRAAVMRTWPATWTNTACGHPAPGENLAAAAVRRCRDELGLAVRELRLVLPGFGYRAVMDDGTVENELCPVLVARADADPTPLPDEVDDWSWVPWDELAADVLAGTRDVSPWCIEQVEQLTALGAAPADWPEGDRADLPPAAAGGPIVDG